jgi:hypothetical protein
MSWILLRRKRKKEHMKKYSFLLKDGFRIDVKASTPKAAYNKLNKISTIKIFEVTKKYIDYAKDSSVYGWRSL